MIIMILYGIFFIILFTIDRLSKWLVLQHLDTDIIIFSGMKLSLAWNKGISWGMFAFEHASLRMLLTGIILLVIVLFCIYVVFEYQKRHTIFFEIMVLTGAISNIIDRMLYGAVIDFIELYYKTWYWPTFNIADVLIVLGVGGILLKQWKDSSSY